MTVVTLGLDLFEKFYLIIRSSETLRKKYILRLGELHAVFAHIRAIGSYICESGIDSAWISANWFDGECVVRQVLECKHMKRALEAHGCTTLAISTLILEHILREYPHEILMSFKHIETIIRELQEGINSQKWSLVLRAFENFYSLMDELKVNELLVKFDEKCAESKQYQFLKIYQKMVVERLFTFIEASRTRKWKLHLPAAEDLMKDFCSMDHIKHRRMWAVYITDMKQLQYDHPEIWKHFYDGYFSIQKSMVPGTAIGRDHAGEQEVKKLKTRECIKGITRNDNSRMRHFLVAPILSEISKESEVMGNGIEVERNKLHHQLRETHTANQNKRISSLLDVFKIIMLSFSRWKMFSKI